MTTKRGFLLAVTACASISAICPAFAEGYPARPITMIVPFPAGGPTDVVARILAERMRGGLGQSVLVENSTGAAGGTVGVGRVARAAPDGYTLCLGLPARMSSSLRRGLADEPWALRTNATTMSQTRPNATATQQVHRYETVLSGRTMARIGLRMMPPFRPPRCRREIATARPLP